MTKPTDTQLDRLWAIKAIESELEAIGRMHGDNVHIPGCDYWVSLIKICSILKGSGKSLPIDRVKQAVLRAMPDTMIVKGTKENAAGYLWGRAYNRAKPRYRIKV